METIQINRKKAPQKAALIAGMAVSIVLIMISSILLYIFYPYASNEKRAYVQSGHSILFHGKLQGNAIVENGTVYVPVSFIQKNIDPSLFEDQDSHSVVLTTKDKVIHFPDSSLEYYINDKEVKLHFPAAKSAGGEQYIALDPLLELYGIRYKELKETGILFIEKNGDILKHATVKNQKARKAFLRLREKPDLQSPYYQEVTQGEKVVVENESDGFLLVRKENGTAGYIEKDYINTGREQTVKISQKENAWAMPKSPYPIQLAWEAVYSRNPDVTSLPSMTGVNIVSPTWFHLINGNGEVDNMGSNEYVNWAEKNQKQIWGVFTNSFDAQLTHDAFSNYEKRQAVIRQLLHYSKMYRLGGINLDIENVDVADKAYVTQFTREAAARFHQAGLVVSMDVTFLSSSGNWSQFYDRRELAKSVDYLMVMAYDEHWASSQEAGSVASLPWVEENLQNLLEQVPNEKIVLGVPLYTRLWKETTDDSGAAQMTSQALKMQTAQKWMAERNLSPQYDPETGQNFVQYTDSKEKAIYRMWLEDETSLQKRVELADKYGLAGIAAWARIFADDKAWTAMNSSMTAFYQKK
ncbi:glycosyl hydrolase family 18 protein [Falsibacillus pallidus]|uniref:glycosyl hydrolase family 18 protein n=1 Tax=Falsibacillus pallidus TaxID=493781 RepID=UPI003D9908F9